MNNEAIEQLLDKNPNLRNRREALEAMVSGAYCMHASWGFGQIKKYDAAANRLVIDFFDFRIWPVFNVADIAIVLGVAGMIFAILFRMNDHE